MSADKRGPNGSNASRDAALAKDVVARRFAGGAGIVSIASLLVSSCQAWTGYQQLQDSRAASLKIESNWPEGTRGSPMVKMRITELSNRTIPNAMVGMKLNLLEPDKVSEIYNDMEEREETIQAGDKGEPQEIHATGTPYPAYSVAAWRKGKLVLVGALRVRWKDKGAWTHTEAERCWAWTYGGEMACEDLIELGARAPAYIQQFIATHPNDGSKAAD